MKSGWIYPVVAFLVCEGCTMAPKYTRPEPPVPGAWPEGNQGAETRCGSSAHTPCRGKRGDVREGIGQAILPFLWQDFFGDPGMKSMIQLALQHNRDLRVAALNVEKAHAMYRIQRSELSPTMGIMASGQRYRLPEKMDKDGNASTVEQDSVQFGLLSWEVDFFGRIQSLKARALNQYLATKQAQRAAELSLIAAVAQGYLQCAAQYENHQLAKTTCDSQKAMYDLIQKSYEWGVASELDVQQAKSQWEASRSDVAKYRGLLAVSRNALELLVGTQISPEGFPKGLLSMGEIKDVSAGLPSDVLLKRPDVLMSEFQLQAANANIGAARAAFFPSVSITAGIGTMSPSFSSLFTSGTRTWSFAPQIVAPIFTGGSLWANLKVSKIDKDIALAQYEKAIQSAFQEVGDGLVLRASLVEQLDAQRSLVKALDTNYQLSSARYKEGLDGYLGVLVAERALYAAEQGLVATRLAHQVNQITLYKALGGQL